MKLVKNGKKVFIYVRVSTQEQAKEGYSIDEQIDRLKMYCKAMGWVVVKIYVDGGYTGSDMNRPALQDMIKDIKAGKADSVVVYKLDRLSRSQKDTLHIIEDILLKHSTDFVSMNENFDTGTSFGRAMIGILAVFAQLEREQIKERMTMGKEARVKSGKWGGSCNAPVGYEYKDGELVINDFEAMQVRKIYELYLKGLNFCQIERELNDKGYTHRYGKWNRTLVRNAMVNKIYQGYVKYNEEYHKGNHEPIIDEKTFEKANTLYQSRDFSKFKNNGRSTYLGGLIFCECCTARYTLSKNGNYRYYICHSRRKSTRHMVKDPNCKNKIYKLEVLDNAILEEIKKLALNPDEIEVLQKANLSDEMKEKENLIKKELDRLHAQKSRFMDLYGVGEFTLEEVNAKVKPINEHREKLEKELQGLNGNRNMTKKEVIEIISNFEDIINRGVFEEIRLMIASLIEKIEINGDDVNIFWRFA